MLPFEFIVEGPPISQQTRDRVRLHTWQRTVGGRAQARLPAGQGPVTVNVRIRMFYYYEGDPLDTDNMIKPIQDALIGIVYADDNQVTDVVAGKRSLNGSFKVKGMSPVLAEGFCSGREFIHVRVDEAPTPEELI